MAVLSIILDLLTFGLMGAAGTYIMKYVLHYVAKDEADTSLETSMKFSIGVTVAYVLVSILFGRVGFIIAIVPVTFLTMMALLKLAWVPESRVARVGLVFMAVYLLIPLAGHSLANLILSERFTLVGMVPRAILPPVEIEVDQDLNQWVQEEPPAPADNTGTNEAAAVQHILSEYMHAPVDIERIARMLDGWLEPTYYENGFLLPLLTTRNLSESNTVVRAPMGLENPVPANLEAALEKMARAQARKRNKRGRPRAVKKPKIDHAAKAALLAEIRAMDPAGWQNTEGKLGNDLRSVYSMNGTFLAIINDEMVWEGKTVSIEHAGKHFIWTLASLSMHNLEWEPVGIADTKPNLRNKFPRPD